MCLRHALPKNKNNFRFIFIAVYFLDLISRQYFFFVLMCKIAVPKKIGCYFWALFKFRAKSGIFLVLTDTNNGKWPSEKIEFNANTKIDATERKKYYNNNNRQLTVVKQKSKQSPRNDINETKNRLAWTEQRWLKTLAHKIKKERTQ